jgi:hypothetical protein
VIHAALIPAMIGASRAAWLLLTGETIDAGTAASWGLVHDVVPDDELDARTAQLAAHIAALGPQAVRHQKRLLNQWTDMTPARAIEDSIAQFGLAFLTGEPTTRTIKLDITPQKSANLRAVARRAASLTPTTNRSSSSSAISEGSLLPTPTLPACWRAASASSFSAIGTSALIRSLRRHETLCPLIAVNHVSGNRKIPGRFPETRQLHSRGYPSRGSFFS